MSCEIGKQLDETFALATRASVFPKTGMSGPSITREIRHAGFAASSQNLIDARFALVNHKADCPICIPIQEP
jgi:hypothetical protein